MNELEEVEHELCRWAVRPPDDLRDRVLLAVQAELTRAVRREWPVEWRFVAAVAAAAVLWIHLSWSAMLHLEASPQRPEVAVQVMQTAEHITRILPQLDRREANRQALLLQAGANLAYYKTVQAPVTRVD